MPGRVFRVAWWEPAALAGLFVGVLGLLLFLIQGRAFDVQSASLVRVADDARESMQLHLNSNQDFLKLLAEGMAQGSLNAETCQAQASQYASHHPELINIFWADAEFVIRWTAPYEPNKQVVGLTLSLPEPQRASRLARDTRHPTYTRPFVVIQGQPAFEVYVPVFRDEEFLGIYGGVYSIERVLRNTVGPFVADEYQSSFLDEEGNALLALPRSARIDARLVKTVALNPPGFGVALRLARYQTGLGWEIPVLALLSVSLALGMGWSMWVLNRRTLERVQAEEELKRHRDHLEELVTERTAELTMAIEQLEEQITMRRQAERQIRRLNTELEQRVVELQRSNAELEQFAYVASHDLKEPLRAITGYLQFLERRYAGKLGADADQFITRSVAATMRMKTLIEDLLALSRVGTQEITLELVESSEIFERAMANLQGAIEESGAILTHDPMPTVKANVAQLTRLFQNLLANAIKFRGDQVPEIHVGVERRAGESEWVFSVRDNGIGIDPQYAERIFLIFQRLHTRTEYPGTGIGLAMCKKIVQRHGGRIWVESEPGVGTTFFFTIPGGSSDPARRHIANT